MSFRINSFVRLFAFSVFLILVLVLVSIVTFVLVDLGKQFGWLKDEPIELTANAIVTAILGITGLVGLALAYQRTLFENETVKARFVFNLNQVFFQDSAERDFFQKLDHGDFSFEPEKFKRSEDEKQLDRLLYKLSHVGKLLRDKIIDLDDINFVRHIAASTLKDQNVIAYLQWLKQSLPYHSSFVDAVYLFEKVHGKRDEHYPLVKKYLDN